MCGSAEEDLDHLLLHCQTIWALWGRLISIPGFRWACLRSIKELPEGSSVYTIRKKRQHPCVSYGQFGGRGIG